MNNFTPKQLKLLIVGFSCFFLAQVIVWLGFGIYVWFK